MAKNFKLPLLLISGILVTLGITVSLQGLMAAWTSPTAAPPANNTEAPVNVGTTTQAKLGSLGVGGNFVAGTNRFYVNAATGYVGIGTTNPSTILELATTTGNTMITLTRGGEPYTKWGYQGWTPYTSNNASFDGTSWNYVNPLGYSGMATMMTYGWGEFNFLTANNAANPAIWNSRLYIANDGSVGIGTTTPSSRLHVQRNIDGDAAITLTNSVLGYLSRSLLRVGQSTGNNSAVFAYNNSSFDSTSWGPGYDLIQPNAANILSLGSATNGLAMITGANAPIVFGTGGYDTANERMRITGTGNVGVNNSSPGYRLDVGGDINFTGTLRQNGIPVAFGGQWLTSGSNIYNSNSGNVGIGTSTPKSKLSVLGEIMSTGPVNGSASIKLASNVNFNSSIKGYTEHIIFGPYNSDRGQLGALYIGSGRSADNSRNNIYLYNAGCTPDTPGGTDNNCYAPLIGLEADDIWAAGNLGVGAFASAPGYPLDVRYSGNTGAAILRLSQENVTKLWTGTVLSRSSIEKWFVGMNATDEMLRFRRNGSSDDMIIDDSGNVGIGTSIPGHKLEVAGTAMFSSGGSSVYMYEDATAGHIVGYNSTYNSLDIRATSGTGSGIYLPSGGNVGIGTVNPLLKLETWGTGGLPATSGTAQIGIIRLAQSNNGVVLDSGINSTSPYGGWLQATNRSNLSINYPLLLNPNGGNVGIGNSSPATRLSILGGNGNLNFGSAFTTYNAIWLNNGTASTNYNILSSQNATDQDLYINRPSSFDINFRMNNTDQMILNSSGNLGIGTVTANSRVTVTGGDVYIQTQGRGVIIRDTDGAGCHRITVNTAGTISAAVIACP